MNIDFKENVVAYIDEIIKIAIENDASDIHFEADSKDTYIRLRIDGDLIRVSTIPKEFHQELIARIKILSSLDIAERRLPQDGRFSIGEKIDLRVSIIPAITGESAVIRILNNKNNDLSIDDLNFNHITRKTFDSMIRHDSGMIISTGPTGCGKTTTLYSLIKELNQEKSNILTIEDPVEYKIDGLKQVQVNNTIGMDFSRALRSMLRADPDIMMVGEIRDVETAEIAVRASITGHLVLTSLHTVDALSAIIRLIDMGIEPYMIASSVTCLQSQRLIKRLCPNCSEIYSPDERQLAIVESVLPGSRGTYRRPKGCPKCINGYKGRQVISEIIIMDNELRKLIKEKPSIDSLRSHSLNNNFTPMIYDGLRRVLDGDLYLDDVLRSVILSGDYNE